MTIGVVGTKSGMTRIFTEDGQSIPVTVIAVEPNQSARLVRDHGGTARFPIEGRHLSHAFTRGEFDDHASIANHAHTAIDDDVERVAEVALLEELLLYLQ